jgi:hypothetical protein
VGRERRVVTPDGYVWYVRRRRARRRPPWSRRPPRQAARYHAEEELPAEAIPLPGLLDLFTTSGEHLGERGFRNYHPDDRSAASMALTALLATAVVAAFLAWLTVEHVLPWLVPLVAANVRWLLGVAAALAVLAAVDHLLRPWYVELQRQGLQDAPRRVWRIRGWRRSGRLMEEITAAIQDGRIDNRRAVILLPDGRR